MVPLLFVSGVSIAYCSGCCWRFILTLYTGPKKAKSNINFHKFYT